MPIQKRYKYGPLILAITITVVGLAVLLCWFTGIGWLTKVYPSFVSMKVNTAIAFVFCGLGLLAFYFDKYRAALVCGLLVSLIGLFTLSQYIFGFNLGIDQVFIEEAVGAEAGIPGRMSPITAANFIFIGIVLTLLASGRFKAAVNLNILPATTSFLALLGYIFMSANLYKLNPFTGMALHTSATFILFSVAVILLQPRTSFMSIFSDNRLGGMFARKFLPVVFITPVFFGWIFITGQQFGWYDSNFAIALSVAFTIVITLSSLFVYAKEINDIDSDRYQLTLELTDKSKEVSNLLKQKMGGEVTAYQVMNTEPMAEQIAEKDKTFDKDEVARLEEYVILLESKLKDSYSQK